jgi:hypothetical protein
MSGYVDRMTRLTGVLPGMASLNFLNLKSWELSSCLQFDPCLQLALPVAFDAVGEEGEWDVVGGAARAT